MGKGGSYARHSRGWADLLQHLKSRENLRVLDFGATSSSNINYLTSLGHSVYMAHIVQDAAKPEWLKPVEGGAPGATEFDVDRFEAANLDFSGRDFNVVLLWDTANYLPPAMVPLLFKRMREVLQPDGRLLAFFHGRKEGPGTIFSPLSIDGQRQFNGAEKRRVSDSGDLSNAAGRKISGRLHQRSLFPGQR